MILDLIDKISIQEAKRAAIKNYLSMAKRQPKKQEVKYKTVKNQFYLLDKIFRVKEEKKKDPTISDLQKELKETKEEIVQLKNKIQVLEMVSFKELSQHRKDFYKEEDKLLNEIMEEVGIKPIVDQPSSSKNLDSSLKMRN